MQSPARDSDPGWLRNPGNTGGVVGRDLAALLTENSGYPMDYNMTVPLAQTPDQTCRVFRDESH